MIDILIPTYNRAECLKKNILILNKQINEDNLQQELRIIISDNHSTDSTQNILSEIKNNISAQILAYRQDTNIGLEPNALFLLKKASSEYVMYLGDDDYLPDGYLSFVIDKAKNEAVHCVMPGFSGLFQDGTIKPVRNADFALKKYQPGFSTVCKLSNYGHQLSGLVTKRAGLYETYMKREENRNLYPFVYFVTHCMLRGHTYYAPKYQVLVSQGNTKDWRYDDSGLLVDVFKNYKTAFPEKPLKAAIASLAFAKTQSWRLRVGKNPLNAIKAFFYLTASKEVSPLIKASLIALYPYCYIERTLSLIKKQLTSGSPN